MIFSPQAPPSTCFVAKIEFDGRRLKSLYITYFAGASADSGFHGIQRERRALADMDRVAGLYIASFHCVASQMETLIHTPVYRDPGRSLELPGHLQRARLLWDSTWHAENESGT